MPAERQQLTANSHSTPSFTLRPHHPSHYALPTGPPQLSPHFDLASPNLILHTTPILAAPPPTAATAQPAYHQFMSSFMNPYQPQLVHPTVFHTPYPPPQHNHHPALIAQPPLVTQFRPQPLQQPPLQPPPVVAMAPHQFSNQRIPAVPSRIASNNKVKPTSTANFTKKPLQLQSKSYNHNKTNTRTIDSVASNSEKDKKQGDYVVLLMLFK